MAYDLVVKNGWIIDGTGLPRFFGDVAAKDGKFVEIGRVNGPAQRTLDAEGRVIAPGFIDIHTHYDAQITWDPLATSSCWHGITSVVFGNCGFAVAPCKPEDREYLIQMLTRVEGMDMAVLRAGTRWNWETYPEYLDALEGNIGVNAGALIGHSAVRYYVMGPEAYERAATPDEIERMKAIIREGLRAGGLGFSTSRQHVHVDLYDRPVPSRLASDEELLELVSVLGELNVGLIEIVPGLGGPTSIKPEMRHLMVEMARRSGRPLYWNTLMQQAGAPDAWRGLLEYTEDAFEREKVQVWALNTCHRLDRWFNLATKGDRPFGMFPVWQEILALEVSERAARLRDPQVRDRLREDMKRAAPAVYKDFTAMIIDEPVLEKNRGLAGKSVAELAAQRGVDGLDAMLDLALEEDLKTEFKILGISNIDDSAVAEIVRHPYTLPGTSDAGAHMETLCGYGVPAQLLGKWVREKGALTLEEGVRRLTSMPAAIAGIPNRGMIREGMAADLTIFDPETIRAKEPEGARDLPGGAWRLVQGCEGVYATAVNGQVLIEEGKHTGALPGRVLRNRLAVRTPVTV